MNTYAMSLEVSPQLMRRDPEMARKIVKVDFAHMAKQRVGYSGEIAIREEVSSTPLYDPETKEVLIDNETGEPIFLTRFTGTFDFEPQTSINLKEKVLK